MQSLKVSSQKQEIDLEIPLPADKYSRSNSGPSIADRPTISVNVVSKTIEATDVVVKTGMCRKSKYIYQTDIDDA